MTRVVVFAGLLATAACGGAERKEEAARAAMLPVIQRIVASEYAGAPVVPMAECIADNANEDETFRLVEAALQGISGSDTQMVRAITRRAETRACLAEREIRLPA